MPILIQCVVVLYRQLPEESKALSSLLEICHSDRSVADRIAILVQDNSPNPRNVSSTSQSELADPVEYRHSPSNPGLADAYNHALRIATERGIPWLLLFDQDTYLTRQFFLQLFGEIESNAAQCSVFVPQLIRQGVVLSPQYVGKVLYRRMPLGFHGLASSPVVAFNSAACFSIPALQRIGGFPAKFWLDYLDHMVFHSLQQAGSRVFVLNSQLDHNLSLADIETDVTGERYQNILRAEWMFVRESGWGGGPAMHRVRLLKRTLSLFIKLRNKTYSLLALRAAFTK